MRRIQQCNFYFRFVVAPLSLMILLTPGGVPKKNRDRQFLLTRGYLNLTPSGYWKCYKNKSCSTFSHLPIFKFSNHLIAESSNCLIFSPSRLLIIKSSNCRIVESSNCRIVSLSNRQIVEFNFLLLSDGKWWTENICLVQFCGGDGWCNFTWNGHCLNPSEGTLPFSLIG
jgi:hypothetical protein